MKIEIFGAAASGKTTLSKILAQKRGWEHLETENYLWEKTDPPYQINRPVEERLTAIAFDFHAHENVVLSGCVSGWGKKWESAFDLAVFLFVPPEIRMERLYKREVEEYGRALQNNPIVKKTHKEFMEWAKSYDDEKDENSEIKKHKKWMEKLKCPVIEIIGDTTIEERIILIENKIMELNGK
jgi:adenylate kinase family enzyme